MNLNHEHITELLTKNELSKRLKVCMRSIENWTNQGLIPKIKIGSATRYNWQQVMAAIEKIQHTAP